MRTISHALALTNGTRSWIVRKCATFIQHIQSHPQPLLAAVRMGEKRRRGNIRMRVKWKWKIAFSRDSRDIRHLTHSQLCALFYLSACPTHHTHTPNGDWSTKWKSFKFTKQQKWPGAWRAVMPSVKSTWRKDINLRENNAIITK